MNDEQNRTSDVTDYDFSNTDEALIKCFKIDHPSLTEISSRDQILKLVNISQEFRTWYLDYKALRKINQERPKFITGNDKSDLLAWERLRAKREESKVNEKNWQQEVTVASNKLRDVIESVEKRKKAFYSNIDPLLVISRITVDQLPREDLVSIALIPDDTVAKETSDRLVLNYQIKLYEDLKNGCFINPMEKPTAEL